MLGIQKYKPIFSTTTSQFIEKHKKDLQHLIGKKVNCYYLQWETKEDRWNEDGPIILKIGKSQYEFTAFQLDEYSLTINQIDLSKELNWYGATDEIPLIWKKNAIDEMNILLNKRIEHIYLLAHSMTSGIIKNDEQKEFFKPLTHSDFFMVGIEFKLDGIENHLQLSNGLDCNVMKMETTKMDAKNRRMKVEKV